MSDPFMPEKETEITNRSVVVRSSGYRHTVIDVHELIATILQAGSGTEGGGGVPVIDSHTGLVVAIAHPDPVTGILTYTDPRKTVVEETSGQGRLLTPIGRPTVQAVIDTAPPTQPPDGTSDFSPPEPTGFPIETEVTPPSCDGTYCFVSTKCDGFAGVRVDPRTFREFANLGPTAVTVLWLGRRIPPSGIRPTLGSVRILPGMEAGILSPQYGTEAVYIGADAPASGSPPLTGMVRWR